MKTYRRHYCQRQHRTHHTTAKCLWPRAVWITGEGPYATLAWCRVLSVMLHPTEAEALAAKHLIDSTGCGGRCNRRHELILIATGVTR
ncbi:hypothetical protein DLJ47_17835 [Micromonospora sp. S4605]|uniref:hypothetical protein n=1 Tax=Micromonospora sp. S4605 TaxID=1420897 RepID=UPI000D6F2F83|nr:hypothetical protein [Micromonospora sp. S4605]PWU52813.1 hypothetical protein DLJ47_17835 [Micromonospora sp. S4605]